MTASTEKPLSEINRVKYLEFQMKEAQWLDSIVRPMIPAWMRWFAEKNQGNLFGRLSHFLVDVLWIKLFLKIHIERGQDTVILGGKGFRQGVDHGYKISNIRTKVMKRGKEIAQQKFSVDMHFTQ